MDVRADRLIYPEHAETIGSTERLIQPDERAAVKAMADGWAYDAEHNRKLYEQYGYAGNKSAALVLGAVARVLHTILKREAQ